MALAAAVAPLAGRPDVVLATTPPLFTGARRAGRSRGMNRAPLVLDVRDLWPAAATSLSQISPGWPTQRAELIERRLYRAAPRGRRGDASVLRAHRRDPRQAAAHGSDPERHARAVLRRRAAANRLGVPATASSSRSPARSASRRRSRRCSTPPHALDGEADFAFVGEGPMKELLVEQAARARARATSTSTRSCRSRRSRRCSLRSDALLVPLSAHPTFEQFVPSKLDRLHGGRPAGRARRGRRVRADPRAVRRRHRRAAGGSGALVAAVRWLAEHPDGGRGHGRARVARSRGPGSARLQAARLEQLLLDVRPYRRARLPRRGPRRTSRRSARSPQAR